MGTVVVRVRVQVWVPAYFCQQLRSNHYQSLVPAAGNLNLNGNCSGSGSGSDVGSGSDGGEPEPEPEREPF